MIKSDSTQKECVQDYAEMNNLFKEHGVEDTVEETDTHAYMYGFDILGKKNNGFTLDMHLYFLAPDDTILVAKIIHEKDNPHRLVKYLRSKNANTRELSGLIGTEISLTNKEDSWKMKYRDIELDEFNHYRDDWEPVNSLYDDKTFREFYTNEPESKPKIGYGIVKDYYVQKSASNITQDLEVGLTIQLPDGSTEEYECIHDKDNKDKVLEKLLSKYSDSNSIMTLKGKKIPVVLSEEENQWCFHLKSHILDVVYYIERLGFTNRDNGQSPIIKTYKHANE